MKHLLTIALVISVMCTATAQCSISLPANTVIMTADGSYTCGGVPTWVWLCPNSGVTAQIYSEECRVLVEAGDTAIIQNQYNHYVYVKIGGTVIITSTASLITVYHEPGATIIDNGSNTYLVPCAEFDVDYSQMSGPCLLAFGTSELQNTETFSVFPTVTDGHVELVSPLSLGAQPFRILDGSGRIMRTGSATQRYALDLSDLPPATYTILVDSPSGPIARRIVRI